MYVYIQTERNPDLFTVGHYDPETNDFIPESDHPNTYAAAERVRYLNGGMPSELELRLKGLVFSDVESTIHPYGWIDTLYHEYMNLRVKCGEGKDDQYISNMINEVRRFIKDADAIWQKI